MSNQTFRSKATNKTISNNTPKTTFQNYHRKTYCLSQVQGRISL